jgi:hypothetical protein
MGIKRKHTQWLGNDISWSKDQTEAVDLRLLKYFKFCSAQM